IRPLFPEGFYNEVLVIAQLLSYDGENEPDILAMIAASAALTISGVPFMGPIGSARVGYIDGEYILNPTQEQIKEGQLDLVVAGTPNAVMMVESEAKELSEDVMLGAVMFAHAASQKVCGAIISLAEKAAKDPWELATGDAKTAAKDKLKKLGCKEPRARHRPHRNPQGSPPHRRPRHQDRPPDRGDRRLPAAHPWLVAVHPRRDPRDRQHHPHAQRTRANESQR